MTDAAGNTSEIVTIVVNALPGDNPATNPAGPIVFLEEDKSHAFSLNGSDADIADNGNLRVVINTLPTLATLFVKNSVGDDTRITAPGTVLTNPEVYLVGHNLSYGFDKFTFSVMDLVNQTSVPSTVILQIIHVNHPPIAGVVIYNGTMNQNLSFNVFGQDPDLDLPLTILVSSVPHVGTLYQADGVTVIPSTSNLTHPTKVSDFNGKLIYSPPRNSHGYPLTKFSIVVDDNSGFPNSRSEILTTDINFERVDLAPEAANFSLTMPQNGQLNVTLNITDPQGYATEATILTFPLHGSLYREDGSEITPSNPNTGLGGKITYVPPLKAWDNDNGPYATLTFRGFSEYSGLVSNVAIGVISVYRAFGPPKFTGLTEYTIRDNTNLTMLLTGTSETGSYDIQILSPVGDGRGFIFTHVCMGTEMCVADPITDDNVPYAMDSPEMEYVLRYAPPVDEYGNAFANFTLIVTDSAGQSEPVTIVINIYHINGIPFFYFPLLPSPPPHTFFESM